MPSELLSGIEHRDLPKRKLTEETCRKWGYGVADLNGGKVQVATYCDDEGRPVAQKIRFPDKTFLWRGEPKQAALYGQWLWEAGGRMVVVTEGEIDALSMSQVQGNKWPVVSIPNGAPGAKNAIKEHLEWLESFESVVLMFDNDEPGKAAALECAALLSPGRAKIATLPLKDASDMLQAERGPELISAMWGAKTYRPDGIVSGDSAWDLVIKQEHKQSYAYPFPQLQEMTRGIRTSEIVTFTAGSGIGKSEFCREVAYHLLAYQDAKVGYIALEESVRRTALGLMSKAVNKPLHVECSLDQKDLKDLFDKVCGDRVFFYDHFGSLDSDNLLAKIRYMAKALDCKFIVLDHISIVVSGLEDGDERRTIDNLMTKLRSLVQELDVGMLLVSHLKRPEGKGHEEGARTALAQLRGSGSIAQLSDIVVGFERDQQSEESKDLTVIRVLKNRYTGDTGLAGMGRYDKETGRITHDDGIFPNAEEKDADY